MKDFSLEIIFSIMGIGAASGLFYKDNAIYLISDNSNYLYKYVMLTGTLKKVLLNADDNVQEHLPKEHKRDFEALAFEDPNLYIYGSGSTNSGRRDSRITFNLDNDQSQVESLTPLFRRLQGKFDIAIDNFNIEGAIHRAGEVYLFNRGNGPKAQNGVFKLTAEASAFIPIALPSPPDMKFGFTDAILVGDDAIYFVAAAEDSDSSSAIIVQGLANNTLSGSLWRRLGKELSLSLLNGLVLGVILLIGSHFLLNVNSMVGITVTASLISVILIASLIGTVIPITLNKVNIDPALATGPFITTSNDICGILIYFSIAKLILRF